MSTEKWWFPIGGFAIRASVSLVIYVIIVLPAIALYGFVALAEQLGLTPFLVRMFRLLECATVLVDVVFFLVYLANDLRNFIRETWK